MTARLPRRRPIVPGGRRRQQRVRRASAGLSPARAGAILTILVAAGAIYGLVATALFSFSRLEVSGASLTPKEAIDAQLGLTPGANLVTLSTEPLAAALRELPSLADARVSVALPDAVQVQVVERRPILIWAVGSRRFLVDDQGLLFADAAAVPPDVVAALPVITDGRAKSSVFDVQSRLDAVVRDAATRLGSLTPDQVGSGAAGLAVALNDSNGFTVAARPAGWMAIFGLYVPSQRTPAMIPGQVQALRLLLAEAGEANVATVVLADDRKGTYSTPRPTATPKPSKAP
jgi:hypothetical protein